MNKPRIYLHPDGEVVSIGFEDTNDTLLFLKRGDNWRDKERLAKWVEKIEELLDGTSSTSEGSTR